MGDLAEDTALVGTAGRYRATLSSDWEVWGPHGGYVASVALRAAGAEAAIVDPRPISFSCQFLRTARFAPADVTVTTTLQTRRAQALRVDVTQESELVLQAQIWLAAQGDGLAHVAAPMPEVASYDETPGIGARYDNLPNDDTTPRPAPMFWRSIDCRILDFDQWTSSEANDPVASGWFRFVPCATFDDPWLDAARYVIVLDTFTWSAACHAHGGAGPWIAPSLDLAVQFHERAPDAPWLLAFFHSPFAGHAAVAATGRVWSADGRLVASGSSSLLCTLRPAGS